jgi:hypothetical protein
VKVPARFSGVSRAAERIGLAAWFVVIDLLWLAKPDVFGIDARHYQRAASTWLAGGDPWTVVEGIGGTYASGPHTLLFYAPTSLLPLDVSMVLWMAAGLLASWWLIRMLRVPIWWLLFPPLAHAIWNGNPQTIALALLVSGTVWGAVIAVGLKLYAALTLVLRPKTLIVVGLALLVSLVVLPWQLYLDNRLGVGEHLATAWNGSAWRFPILVAPTLVALWVLRHRGAEWLAVPAALPGTQFYYVGMAMPVVVNHRWLAAAFAIPAPLLVPLVTIAWAAWLVWRSWRGAPSGLMEPAMRSSSPAPAAGTDSPQ